MLTMTSITRRDVFVIQGVVLFVTFIYVLVNLAVDILYGFVDRAYSWETSRGGERLKISNTATDCQTSEVILREQRQIRRERFFPIPG